MKENSTDVGGCTRDEAAKLTAENKHGYVWPSGLYVIVDNARSVLESREEVADLITQLNAEADRIWPQ